MNDSFLHCAIGYTFKFSQGCNSFILSEFGRTNRKYHKNQQQYCYFTILTGSHFSFKEIRKTKLATRLNLNGRGLK